MTTTDILDSKQLKEKPKVRKKLLERRAKDEIRGSHEDHEKFIHDIFKEGIKDKKWELLVFLFYFDSFTILIF